jgi:TRAP-type mannitol/chloroaromatic compound transport system permease large subunit
VEHLFDKLPGGQIGFLIFVNLLVFGLGFFLDFFEIAFIVIPLLAPVAEKLDINLIWFGIIIAMNLQTSFLTPPFGFALFYLRSVAPRNDYIDAVTKKRIPKITTEQIYKGSIAFIVLQVIMVIVLLWQPQLVTGQLKQDVKMDDSAARELLFNMIEPSNRGFEDEEPEESTEDALEPPPAQAPATEVDPLKALQESLKTRP